ncbi:UDP-2,3-diacylglucosamine diphosphatase [Sulfurimonas sp.]|uniref:UDP-2,3-diacylglucosamine diphosphatase n=1 Tax=Sulfurimonas sp. TaxID=2022749 RepID=UPI002AB2F813|nr:metallophosphoesterase [Sulfurimonas sp.]
MSHNLELKEGAFIISDAHYSHRRPELLNFLQDINTDNFSPSQLIFMGDIFDTLFDNIPYTHKINAQVIDIINQISKKIELVYIEGNHDFNLSKIFPDAKVFSIDAQPISMFFEDKKVLLAHGDIQSPLLYKVYTSVVRNSFVTSFLNILDLISGHKIIKKLDDYLGEKEDCKEFIGFRKFIQNRLASKYSCNYFIEGHFHQNKTLEFENFTYINLAAFACNQRYFIVKSFKDVKLLEEISYKK